MQIKFRHLSVAILATSLTILSCTKTDKPVEPTSVKDQSEEQNRISSDFSVLLDDVNTAAESEANFSGRGTNTDIVCNATATLDSTSNPRTISIALNGVNCAGSHFRTGTITLSMAAGMHWKDVGAVLNVTYTNVKVKRLSDNKSITVNGTVALTNVNGGLMYQLSSQSIEHTIVSNNMSIKFDDNSLISWHVAKRRVFTYNNGLVLAEYGIHTDGNNTQIAEWGTTRTGQNFVTSILSPVTIRQDCSFRVTSGQIKHEGFATATILFGLNALGAETTCPASGSYFYKIIWEGPNGISLTLIAPY